MILVGLFAFGLLAFSAAGWNAGLVVRYARSFGKGKAPSGRVVAALLGHVAYAGTVLFLPLFYLRSHYPPDGQQYSTVYLLGSGLGLVLGVRAAWVRLLNRRDR